MVRRSWVLLGFLLVAVGCGDDDPAADAAAGADAAHRDAADPDATPPDAEMPDANRGNAAITGTLAEQDVIPVSAYHMVHPSVGKDIVVMPEEGMACDLDDIGDGQVLVVGFPCGPPVAFAYPVLDESGEGPCTAGDYAFVLVEGFTGEFPEYNAVSGTVTITSVATQVVGELSADFGVKGSLAGSFSAVVCQ